MLLVTVRNPLTRGTAVAGLIMRMESMKRSERAETSWSRGVHTKGASSAAGASGLDVRRLQTRESGPTLPKWMQASQRRISDEDAGVQRLALALAAASIPCGPTLEFTCKGSK